MEKISALMDGELDEHQARQELARLKQDSTLAEGWHTFHLIGDALRGERFLSRQFDARLTTRMAQEPTVLAPRRAFGLGRRGTAWALSAAASVAAVALVGWVALSSVSPVPSAPSPELAQAAAPVQVVEAAPAPASEPGDGKMNEYLIAHQEFSPSTAIQGLAPYIRSVSITQPAQGR